MDVSYGLIFTLPGQGLLLHLDPLSLFFLVLLLPQIAASIVAGLRVTPGFWSFVTGMVLTILAGSVFVLVFGLGMMAFSVWSLAARVDVRRAAPYAGIMVFSMTCLVPALSLPVSSMAFILVVLGVAAMAGLAPFYSWRPRLYAALPASLSALLSGGAVNVAVYVLLRYVFVSAAGFQQPWWGVLLMALGAVSILYGALRASVEIDLGDSLFWSAVEEIGVVSLGVGVALWAKASLAPDVSGLALQAVLLGILAYGLFKPLMLIGVGEVRHAVGTTSLNWLGGLMRGMPRLGMLMLLGVSGVASLPLGPAFAPVFLLVHAIIGMALPGGIAAYVGAGLLLAVIGMAMTLMFLTALKIIGLGFLGRPHSLHAAAAEEVRRGPFLGMALLGGLCLPVALVPGLILFLCAPVVHLLAPLARTESLAYAPLTLLGLACVALVIAGFVQTRWGVRDLQETPAWNGGFDRPPAWLPFGDPHTQSTASGFAREIGRVVGLKSTLDPSRRCLLRPLLRLYLILTRFGASLDALLTHLTLPLLFITLMLVLLYFGWRQGG